jgi:sugar transferase (PEP-CTERM/EpsH1 system associated)
MSTDTTPVEQRPPMPVNVRSEQPCRKVLILTPSLPYPPIWGFGIRVYQFLRLLARNHRVHLLTFAGPNDAERIAHLETVCEAVHTVPGVPDMESNKRRGQVASLLSPVSFQRRNLTSSAMQHKLDEICAQHNYDVVQVESSQLAGYRFDPRAAVVLDEHNIEYELLYRMYASDRSPVRRAYNWLEYRKFRSEEIRSWKEATGCVMTSAREREMVREVSGKKAVTVVPNAVDVHNFVPSDAPVDSDSVVMTGLMRYRPNSDAALFFLREVMPLILTRRPNLVFYVVGAGPPEELKRLAGSNVVVTDTVLDVRPYVHKAAVFVVPLRMGSGTRLKVLEGLAMAKPMVSTSLGCEGIDVRHGEHLLVADEPAHFADAVLKLMSEPELGARLGRTGRELVLQQYSWETVVEELERFYDELLSDRGAVGK